MANVTTRDCWHCSLLSYEVSYLTSDTMHHFAGYVLPGLIFSILGLRWAAQLIYEWTQAMLVVYFEANGLPATPAKVRIPKSAAGCLFSLPWEGIVKLVLTGLGIIVSVVASAPSPSESDEYVSSIRYATIYLFFALSGLTDILVYYCGYSILPEGIQSLILSLAFYVEGVMFAMRLRFEGYLEQQIHLLLVVSIFSCALTCTLEVLYDNRLVKFCRAYLCLVQGTWLMHGGFIMQGSGIGEAQTYPDSLEWVSILFSWHVAGHFVIFTAALLTSAQLAKRRGSADFFANCLETGSLQSKTDDSSSSTPRSSSFHSPTTIQTSASPNLPPGFSYIQKQQLPTPPPITSTSSFGTVTQFAPASVEQSELAKQAEQMRRLAPEYVQPGPHSTGGGLRVTPVIVEAMPKDSIVLSDEYRTLSREDELRASIKLKESSLI